MYSLVNAFDNWEEWSTTASNSNIVTDHVPPHLKVGYDEANDYPPGTHIVIAWLKEESCNFYTWYFGEFIKIDVLDLCVIVSFNLQCIICSANLLSQFVHYFGVQKISKSSATYIHSGVASN